VNTSPIRLRPKPRPHFDTHIADCRNCWRFLRGYREVVALGCHLQEEEIPSDIGERLETFLRHRLQRPSCKSVQVLRESCHLMA
jgi:hypothetical protein